MSITTGTQTVTSGNTFKLPDDLNNPNYAGLEKYSHHTFAVSGAGSAVITADQGAGSASVDTLSSDSATYRLPNCSDITVTASGGDITLSVYSDNEGADC